MRSQRYLKIAAELEGRIREDKNFTIPSIAALAASYDAAYQTMWKAVRELANKGIVRTRHGMKTRRADDDRSASASERFRETLRSGIETGEYKAGAMLPKLDNLALSGGVSKITITRALRQLAARDLVHSRKRRWFAGPDPAQRQTLSSRYSPADAPIIVYLYNDMVSWSWSLGQTFSGNFRAPFLAELLAQGMVVSPCLRESGSAKGVPVPAGVDQVMKYIRGLGSRYAGTLTESVHPKGDGLEEWIPALLRFRKPVIYFDHADRGAYLTRKFFSVKKQYYRLFQDEAAAVSIVVARLSAAGHRIIGLHGADIDQTWGQRRYAALREQAARMDPPLQIVAAPGIAPWIQENLIEGRSMVLGVARNAGITDPFDEKEEKAISKFRSRLLSISAPLVSLLRDGKPTALIGLNDNFAREYYIWLRALGGDVPRDLSLVSFDNDSDATFFHLTSIDWGFARLAYLGAHIMIGDIPVRADRQGFIPGACTLIDRGSMGKPGDPAELRRLLRA
jgi:DNA-binding transcriptional regulator YhcF (GntR family)